MKNNKMIRIIVIAMIFFIASTKFTVGQTTQEEYNYVTTGYSKQEAEGGDMKAGYSFKILNTTTYDERKVILVGLYRTSTNVLCAIMIEYVKTGSAVEYLCAPMAGTTEDIRALFWKSLNDDKANVNNNARLQIIAYALSQISFKQ